MLRAPISGSVTERLVNVGAGVEAGKPLVTIVKLSTVRVIANVPEAQVGSLRAGARAQVFSAAPTRSEPGFHSNGRGNLGRRGGSKTARHGGDRRPGDFNFADSAYSAHALPLARAQTRIE